ncbi:MAG TPA: Asp23/Gls24 family envelope stress response protein [Oscillospiraceae bacterium]|nr:Asp23/Gls24 family envelope stress response protein [Oscillospiraceae bacterium]
MDASILVKYGYTIPTVAKAVQEAVAGSIEAMTGLTVGSVNVQVAGIVFDQQDGK